MKGTRNLFTANTLIYICFYLYCDVYVDSNAYACAYAYSDPLRN